MACVRPITLLLCRPCGIMYLVAQDSAMPYLSRVTQDMARPS